VVLKNKKETKLITEYKECGYIMDLSGEKV